MGVVIQLMKSGLRHGEPGDWLGLETETFLKDT